jgi:histidine triad (HIT) family protein
MTTIFTKIINKEIPAKIVYEDELCLAFRDLHPQSPTHILLIPKKAIPSLAETQPEDAAVLGHLMVKIREIADKEGISEKGFRVVTNVRSWGGQTVNHLHFHILGGRPHTWPPG